MEILLVGPGKARVQAARIDARDLGHLRAMVRKDAHARRAGTCVRQIDDLDVGERTFRRSLGAHVFNQFAVVWPGRTYIAGASQTRFAVRMVLKLADISSIVARCGLILSSIQYAIVIAIPSAHANGR